MLITQNKTDRRKLIYFDCDINSAKLDRKKEQNLVLWLYFSSKTFFYHFYLLRTFFLFFFSFFSFSFPPDASSYEVNNGNRIVTWVSFLTIHFDLSLKPLTILFTEEKKNACHQSIFLVIHILTTIYLFQLIPATCWDILPWQCQKKLKSCYLHSVFADLALFSCHFKNYQCTTSMGAVIPSLRDFQ